MEFAHFVRIQRQDREGQTQHVVVYVEDPKLAVEFSPDIGAPDNIGNGLIQRISVPNSWAGNYSQYAKHLTKAQAFFKESFGEPAGKAETRRLQT